MNSLKHLAGIPHEQKVLSPESLSPIQTLKTDYLGSKNPRLHTDEILIALSMCAANDVNAKHTLDQIPKLKQCEVHSSVLLSSMLVSSVSLSSVSLSGTTVISSMVFLNAVLASPTTR